MDKKKQAICVFCGASFGDDPQFRDSARALGEQLAQAGFDLVFGGGSPGLMGEVARGAREAGAVVTGFLPGFLQAIEKPLGHGEITHIVPDLFERKQKMIAASDGFIVLPGGLGTYDEFFEVISSAQLGVLAKPIILVNIDGYYDPLDAMLRATVARGFARPVILELYAMAASPEAAITALQQRLDHIA